jgi:cellulose biosynthesis protein BcsQ
VFITVSGQKGGVAKTCTSIHLASVWAERGRSVCVVDADRNRSALAYGIRGSLPFTVVPVEAAAKATRNADVVITDGQASSDEEELRHLAVGSDLVLLPTAPKAPFRKSLTRRDMAIMSSSSWVEAQLKAVMCSSVPMMPCKRWVLNQTS